MFAIIVDGGHQYRVQQGDKLRIELRSESQLGGAVVFDQVLLANGGGASVVGRPTIAGASVQAEVLVPELKGKKLEIGKLRKRKNSRRHTGHRQHYTSVRITGITVPGLEIVKQPAAATAK